MKCSRENNHIFHHQYIPIIDSAHHTFAQHSHSDYDIVILGAGCAGLSLVMRLLHNKATAQKKILLIDRESKLQNDRTWCYWEAGAGFFEDIVTKQWNNLDFYSNSYSSPLDMAPYSYKMIRGIDFYHYCLQTIQQHPNVTLLYDEVLSFSGKMVQLKSTAINCANALVFSSLYSPVAKQKGRHYLLQHFKGWMVETEYPAFDTAKATLMDFRVSQQHGASFVYVMPLSANKALVEYTLFTGALLEQQQYDTALKDYLQFFLNIDTYKVTETEFGVIPMISAAMPAMQDGTYLIGTAGGQTKASTGYTFQFIQKQAAAISANLAAGKAPFAGKPSASGRFKIYDNTLLRILAQKKLPGDEIFARLFKKNKAAAIFKFLDNETSFASELKIMTTVPQWTFIKAAIAEMIRGSGI
jgi:lycopene beta-cyclase